MNYIIGVDAGGTKTEASAYTEEGVKIAEAFSGSGNMASDRDEAVINIVDSIVKCIDKIGEGKLVALYLGVAGAEAGDNSTMLEKKLFEKFKVDANIVNDGELALRAKLKGEDGILTIAGTGSIAFGIHENRSERCGGWGHLLGDEGSAYGIAIEAFKRITTEADCRKKLSKLSEEILRELGLNKADDIIGFIYSSNKSSIAAISPIVSRLAEKGEVNALEVLNSEGGKLAETTIRVYKKLNFQGECKIAITGSAILKSKVLREAFEVKLNESLSQITIIDEEISPTRGAYYMYVLDSKR